jgi:hypothetical protein
MEANPRYIDLLHSLSQRGLATRPRTAVEAFLAACKHCQHWTADGCGIRTTREFAALLADSLGTCQESSDRAPNKVV